MFNGYVTAITEGYPKGIQVEFSGQSGQSMEWPARMEEDLKPVAAAEQHASTKGWGRCSTKNHRGGTLKGEEF